MFDKLEIIQRRGYLCECGCGLAGQDAHHCFIPNLKRFSEYVNDERNIMIVNHDQHVSRKFDNLAWKKKFWKRQVLRYGQPAMDAWIESLPAKMKHRIDWL